MTDRSHSAKVQDALASDAARIAAELVRSDGTTDPFVAAVGMTRMPMVISNPRLPDNPIVYVNDAFLELTGYGREEIVGRNCRFLQGPKTDPAAVGRIRKAIVDREFIELDLRNHRKDGTAFWNRLLMVPVRDAAGDVAYFFASQFDVTLERERLVNLEARNGALMAALTTRLADLEESESRFRHMADHAPVMVWTTDAGGACTWLNRSWAGFTGQTIADALGAGRLDMVHPTDRPTMTRSFAAAHAARAPYFGEYRLRRADGTYAWVIDAAAPRFGGDGAFMGLVGSVLDVTDRRTAAARLEVSEESLRLATEAAEIGTWDIDLLTDTLTWSDRTKAMFGVSPDVACSMRDFYAGLHPLDYDMTAAAFASAVDPMQRGIYDVEYRTVGKEDGAVRWVAAKGKGLFSEDGRCVRAIGTAIDITAGKAAQARQAVLLAVADRLRGVADAGAAEAAVIAVLEQHFCGCQVGIAVAGAPDGLLGGLDPAEIAALDRGVVLERGDGPGAAGLRAVLVVPLLREGLVSAALYVGHEQPRKWPPEDVALVEDVAARAWDAMERARAVAALRELNATLESRVEERTAALRQAEDALRQSQKMEAVGQLTGGIAHDFNNLLTSIVGALELLQRRVEAGRTEGLQRYADIAVASARRAGALTQRLLAFARRQPLDPRPTDANRLVAGMEELLRRTLGPAVTLEMVLSGGLWPTLCDSNQLESAILNLAINARDAMPDGGRLTVETANAHLDEAYARAEGGEVRPGQYTALSVTDTGAGMAPEVIARAFEPFFTTKPIGQGTGLGLSMVYGFAKQSDGHVRIYSEVGQGTTFRLYLPRHSGNEEGEAVAAAPSPPQAADSHETVLVVEDETAVRMLVVETLAELGYTALEASDGPAGLRILQSGVRVDLLVTDVGLPGLNGRQVADAARALRPGLRVLFITGYAHNAAIGNGVLEAGMEMLTKPFAMDALAAKIRWMITGT